MQEDSNIPQYRESKSDKCFRLGLTGLVGLGMLEASILNGKITYDLVQNYDTLRESLDNVMPGLLVGGSFLTFAATSTLFLSGIAA